MFTSKFGIRVRFRAQELEQTCSAPLTSTFICKPWYEMLVLLFFFLLLWLHVLVSWSYETRRKKKINVWCTGLWWDMHSKTWSGNIKAWAYRILPDHEWMGYDGVAIKQTHLVNNYLNKQVSLWKKIPYENLIVSQPALNNRRVWTLSSTFKGGERLVVTCRNVQTFTVRFYRSRIDKLIWQNSWVFSVICI